jgi:transcriptional regulator with XRE-family HTH domain
MIKKDSRLGETLRKLREEKKLGIKTVAPKAAVTYSYLSKIENGHKHPTKELVEKLCEIYGADQDEVISMLGELPEDIQRIIQKNGREVFDLLRKKYGLKDLKEKSDG